ncbi:MAG TPA: hypothetical protein VNU68_12560 [Verrucomicrobiae bacterium]|nr:hypothetical protein [Verrucomicrobiae bacterium]
MARPLVFARGKSVGPRRPGTEARWTGNGGGGSGGVDTLEGTGGGESRAGGITAGGDGGAEGADDGEGGA